MGSTTTPCPPSDWRNHRWCKRCWDPAGLPDGCSKGWTATGELSTPSIARKHLGSRRCTGGHHRAMSTGVIAITIASVSALQDDGAGPDACEPVGRPGQRSPAAGKAGQSCAHELEQYGRIQHAMCWTRLVPTATGLGTVVSVRCSTLQLPHAFIDHFPGGGTWRHHSRTLIRIQPRQPNPHLRRFGAHSAANSVEGCRR